MKHLKHLKQKLATCAFSAMSPSCLDEWMLVVAELDTGAEVSGSARSTPVPQRSGEHCTTLGEHLRETTAAYVTSICYRSLGEHPYASTLAGRPPLASGEPLRGEHPWVDSFFFD